jgi:hypothetical protein
LQTNPLKYPKHKENQMAAIILKGKRTNVTEALAKALVSLGRATYADAPVAPADEPTPEAADMDESEPVKRKYRTKTMKAD